MAKPEFIPIRVLELDLDRPLADVSVTLWGGPPETGRVLLLVRLHGFPLGMIQLNTSQPVIAAGHIADCIWRELGGMISQHIQADGLPAPDGLTADGLRVKGQPKCRAGRAALLHDAPSVSVIVATRDRTSTLVTALDSILAQDYPNFDIVVVDNAPRTGETRRLIDDKYKDKPVTYLRENRPGLASAHNAGLTHSTGEILAFADDDLRLDPLWLASLVSAFRAHEHVGCVTGLILPAELDKPAQLWFDQYGRLNKGLSTLVFDLDAHRPDSALYPYAAGTFGSGANMAFTREALDAIGGFDTAMGTGTSARGGDDLAAFFDVIMAGFRLVYEPSALVWHAHPSEYAYLRKQAYGYGVGLSAYLTRTIARHPRHALNMLIRLPRGVDHMFNPASPKNIGKPPDYPGELNRLERLGLLAGPLAYARSRWENRGWNSIEAYRGDTPYWDRDEVTSDMSNHHSSFKPIRVVQVELSGHLPDFDAETSETGSAYHHASMLVRLHTQPIGVIEAPLEPDGRLCASTYAPRIYEVLGDDINAHLAADGLPALKALPAAGITSRGEAACRKKMAVAIARAPSVSVVIPTHERAGNLARCLEAFKAVEYPDYELVIVDNQPKTSATADLVERMKADLPMLRYIREDRQGISSARNRGIVEATGELLAFTDDDVQVDPGWLSAMVAAFEASDKVGCVTGLILPVALDKPSQLWFDQYARFNKGLSAHVYDLAENKPDSPLYPYAAGTFGSGANMAFSRAALDTIGGFDTATGTGTSARGGDDLAAFFDVIVAGYGLVYAPAALAWHSHPSDYAYLCKQAYGYGVGLSAYLTRTFARHPRLALTMLARLPRGVDHMFNPASPKNANKPADYPSELTRLERLGLLAGPLAYMRSRWENRAWSSMDAYQGSAR